MRLCRKIILFAIWTCNFWVWRPQELSPQSKNPWFHSFAIYSNLFKNLNLYAKLKSLAAVINVSKLAIKFNLIQIMTLDVIYCKRDTKLKVSKCQKQFTDLYTGWNKLWRSFFLSWTGFKQDTAGKGAFTNYVNLLWPPTDYERPIKPFFIEIPNFWAWTDNLGR